MNSRSQVVSPSPAESHGSSETTSETQSVSDDPSTYSGAFRPIKPQLSRKTEPRTDGAEKEKPPWRPVSIATPSKADRNAMLKAKILDATRRALLLQRISNTSTQTDPVKTVLMRDAHLDAQPDLCRKRDASVETDGAVTLRNDGLQGFILSQTVGQMTETVRSYSSATQTARPQTSLAFSNKYSNNDLDKRLLQNEAKLRQQIFELNAINEKLKNSHWTDSSKKTPLDNNNSLFFLPTSVDFDEQKTSQINLLSEPTLSSWNNNDLIWDNFNECLPFNNNPRDPIAKRLLNMRLHPLPRPRIDPNDSHRRAHSARVDIRHVELYDTLLHETNALLNLVERIPDWVNSHEKMDTRHHFHQFIARPTPLLPPINWDQAVANEWQQLDDTLKRFDARSKSHSDPK